MEYKGKLYGKIGNKYFDTGYTTDDYDGLISRVEELDKIVGQKLPIPDVVGRSEQFKCAMQLSKSGKRCDKQCVECELSYKNYSI